MRIVVLVALLAACKKEPPTELTPVAPNPTPATAPAEAPAAPPPAPEGLEALVRALSARDAGPSCADAEALVPDPVAALSHVVAHVPMPPQAPMRAATCLVDRHPEAVADDLVRWVRDDTLKGLGRLALQSLDTLPEPIAVKVARAAVTGPLSEEALVAVRAAKSDAVRAAAPPQP
jgi:hypothetical protein